MNDAAEIGLTVVSRDGTVHRIVGRPGQSVMEAICDHDIDGEFAVCGGCCSCGTCHVFVDDAFADLLPPLGDQEDGLLDCSDNRTAASRLSCQLPCGPELDGLCVRIAPVE